MHLAYLFFGYLLGLVSFKLKKIFHKHINGLIHIINNPYILIFTKNTLLDFDIENSRVFVIGNPLTNDFDIVTNGDKDFVFVSTPFKSDFISSMKTYIHQYLVDIKRLLTKPLKNMKRSKSVLLIEYEKLKAQWQVFGLE